MSAPASAPGDALADRFLAVAAAGLDAGVAGDQEQVIQVRAALALASGVTRSAGFTVYSTVGLADMLPP